MVRKSLYPNYTDKTQKLRHFAISELLPFQGLPYPTPPSEKEISPREYNKPQGISQQQSDIDHLSLQEPVE
jgi:hypothetical protein